MPGGFFTLPGGGAWTPSPPVAPPSGPVVPTNPYPVMPAPGVPLQAAPGIFAPEVPALATRKGKQLRPPDLGSPLLAAQLAARETPFRPTGYAGLGLRLLGAYAGHRTGLGLVGVVGGWFLGGALADRLAVPR